jgi:hypothetical protein
MSEAMDIFARLAAPFDPEQVEWRVGSTNRRKWEVAKKEGKTIPRRGLPLCYVDARTVMDRLDEVLTPPGWKVRHVPMPNGTTCAGILIRDPGSGEWIEKENGAGATGDTGKADEREMAEKGAYSDAFKRAGVLWGIGRYLYGIKAPWVDLDEWWNIPQSEYAKLTALLARNGAPPKSARQSRKDGDYTRIEGLIRNCKTMRALETLWRNEWPIISQWRDDWLTAITEEKDARKKDLEAAAISQAPASKEAA